MEMKLNKDALQNKVEWKKIGISLPAFDYEAVCEYTSEHPSWIHFGVGNIFRGYIARLQQALLNNGLVKSGIIATETFDSEIIDNSIDNDNLTLLVTLKPCGTMENEVIASITESLSVKHKERLKEIFRNKSLQIVSFTITEKGYNVIDTNNEHVISVATQLLYERFLAGAYPIALVSMDNCNSNGDKLKAAVLQTASIWAKSEIVTQEFIDYLSDKSKVSFPCSMIDKITPRPDELICEKLNKLGLENMQPIITSKGTYIAPFVNAEISEYLVIEDDFPNGRPPLEAADVYLTNRQIVEMTEQMKVTACLNPLHTALAVFGCLLGFTRISDAIRDADLKKLAETLGYKEGLPVVVNPGIIDPDDFLKEVLEVRLPNPFIPDTPQRIATDTSLKFPIRFGETIKAYMANPEKGVDGLTAIPLIIAAWFRYLLGEDDEGNVMQISPDPMLEELRQHLKGLNVGESSAYNGELKLLLSNTTLFTVNLHETVLAEKIETMFIEMITESGAVRNTLQKYIHS